MKTSKKQSGKVRTIIITVLFVFSMGVCFAQKEKKDSTKLVVEQCETVKKKPTIEKHCNGQELCKVTQDNNKKPTQKSTKEVSLEDIFLFKPYSTRNF